MTMLIPNRDKENRDDFVWCLPIARYKRDHWHSLAKKFKTVTPEGVVYLERLEGTKATAIIMLPDENQSDDDVGTGCAWIRMIKQLDCRMYIVRASDEQLSFLQTVAAVMGQDPETMVDMEIEEKPDDTP